MNFSKSIIITSAFLSLSTIAGATTFSPNFVVPQPTQIQTPTPAPVVTVFNVVGIFQDNAILTGSFDVTNGQITSADMHVSGIEGTFTLDRDGAGNFESDGRINVWENIDMNDGGNVLSLDLLLQPGLEAYAGGSLCNASHNCGDDVSFYLPQHDSDPLLKSGVAAAAPEPGATALLGAGLSALGLMLRRRFVKK